jgi:predicted deacylase
LIHTSIDFDRPGKQHGYLEVPHSYNLAGWANLMIPVTVINHASGPSVLVMAGNHGDEYPGQIAIMKLARDLEPSAVRGKIILIPCLNMPAAKASARLSPLDGKNLNRSFPGNPEGTVTEVIADFLTRVLFPIAEAVIDIHTGGRSMVFLPCSHMHVVPNRIQRQKMLEAMLAWNTDFSFLYADIAGNGLLPVEAENQGKVVVTTEMGGGEAVPAHVHQLTQRGLRNVLVHLGVLDGGVETREDLGKPPAILVQALDRENYLLAPESGIFEVTAELGTRVSVDEPIGQIHFLERSDRGPETVLAKTKGYLICCRAPCLTQQGDCVAVIAQAVDPKTLL